MSNAESQFVYELGEKVKCKITGMEGVVTDLALHYSGCNRIGVRPIDESRPDAEFFFEDEIEDVNRQAIENNPVLTSQFALGHLVREEITGFEGYITTLTFNLFNEPRAAIRPKDSDNTIGDREWFDCTRLKLLNTEFAENAKDNSEKRSEERGPEKDQFENPSSKYIESSR